MKLENLKQARKNAGLTQKDVADKLGVNYTTYRNYEQGQREPNHKTILALADLFEVSTDYLLGKEDPLDTLKLSPVGKAIVQLYISLPQNERTTLAEHIIALANGADIQITMPEPRQMNDEHIVETTNIGMKPHMEEHKEKQSQESKYIELTTLGEVLTALGIELRNQ